MDRTKAHADQVGVDYGISNTAPTAAVGRLNIQHLLVRQFKTVS